MAVFAVYIEKEENFQGGLKTFGNTYHFATDTGEPFDDALAIQQVADAEKAVTSPTINFTRGRTWGPTDGAQVDNVMREEVDISGPGVGPNGYFLYRELAVLVVWPMPRSVPLNRKRWLRKFLRVAQIDGAAPEGRAYGIDPLGATYKDLIIANYANPVTDLATLGNFRLCNEEGVTPNADPIVRDYLVTRQIGR